MSIFFFYLPIDVVISNVVLICISFILSDIEHLCILLWGTCISSSRVFGLPVSWEEIDILSDIAHLCILLWALVSLFL